MKIGLLNKICLESRIFFRNFDFINRYRNEVKENNEESLFRLFFNRMTAGRRADSVGVNIN